LYEESDYSLHKIEKSSTFKV